MLAALLTASLLATFPTLATLLSALTLTASGLLTALIALTARRFLATLLAALIFLTIVCHDSFLHVQIYQN